MRFFTRAFDLVSVTLITFLIFSPSTAVPHAGRHHRRSHGHGAASPSAHSGSGLRFNNIDSNRTNHDLYLLPIQDRQLAHAASTASPDNVYGSAATATVNISTGLSGHINSSSVYNGFASQTLSSIDLSAYIVQPHLRVHQTVHATIMPEMPILGYVATVSSLTPTESSPTSAAAATLVYRGYGDMVESSSTSVHLQSALFYTFHLPKFDNTSTKGKKGKYPICALNQGCNLTICSSRIAFSTFTKPQAENQDSHPDGYDLKNCALRNTSATVNDLWERSNSDLSQ